MPTIVPISNPSELNIRDVSLTDSCDGAYWEIFSAVINVSGVIFLPEVGRRITCAEIILSSDNFICKSSSMSGVYPIKDKIMFTRLCRVFENHLFGPPVPTAVLDLGSAIHR